MSKRRTHIVHKRGDTIKLIVKANNLVEARYMFNTWETRFFDSLLTLVGKDDSPDTVYRIWFRDIKNNYGLNSNKSYELLREAAKSLNRKPVYIGWMNDEFRRGREYTLFEFVDYLESGQEGGSIGTQEYVDVKMQAGIRPFILGLKKDFTSYDSRNTQKLKGYSTRIYELLKQFEYKGFRTIRVQDLKDMFLIENEYPRFSTFNQSVITPSIKAINEYTDLYINPKGIKKIKKGRKVDALLFPIQKKSTQEINEIRSLSSTPIALPKRKKEIQGNLFAVTEVDLAEEQQDLYDLVKEWGITKRTVLEISNSRTMEHIRTCIDITKEAENIQNKGAYFISLVKKDTVVNSKKVTKAAIKYQKAKQKEQDVIKQEFDRAIKQVRQITFEKESTIVLELLKDIELMNTILEKAQRGSLNGYIPSLPFEKNYEKPLFKAFVNRKVKEIHPNNFKALNDEMEKQEQALIKKYKQKKSKN